MRGPHRQAAGPGRRFALVAANDKASLGFLSQPEGAQEHTARTGGVTETTPPKAA